MNSSCICYNGECQLCRAKEHFCSCNMNGIENCRKINDHYCICYSGKSCKSENHYCFCNKNGIENCRKIKDHYCSCNDNENGNCLFIDHRRDCLDFSKKCVSERCKCHR